VGTAFSAAAAGHPLPAAAAWYGVIAYSLQLLLRLFGLHGHGAGAGTDVQRALPQNFNSPYQSADIIEFWRRLAHDVSRFLRILYIRWAGTGMGKARRACEFDVTMFLGGVVARGGWTLWCGGIARDLPGGDHAWLEGKVAAGMGWGGCRGRAVGWRHG